MKFAFDGANYNNDTFDIPKWLRRGGLVGLVLFRAVVAVVSGWRFMGPGRQPYFGAAQLLGWIGPKLEVEEWLSTPPDLAGKFVVIDFWATWCASCRKSIPHLNALQERFASRVQFVALADETAAKVNAMPDPRIIYASAIDTQGRTRRAVGVMVLPYLLVMDPQGTVRYEGVPGEGNACSGELLAKIIAARERRGKRKFSGLARQLRNNLRFPLRFHTAPSLT